MVMNLYYLKNNFWRNICVLGYKSNVCTSEVPLVVPLTNLQGPDCGFAPALYETRVTPFMVHFAWEVISFLTPWQEAEGEGLSDEHLPPPKWAVRWKQAPSAPGPITVFRQPKSRVNQSIQFDQSSNRFL
jgi:hypothetical protein